MEGLIWVGRVLFGCGGPEMEVKGFRCVLCVEGLVWVLKALVSMEGIGYVGMGWDGCEGPLVGEGILELIWKV